MATATNVAASRFRIMLVVCPLDGAPLTQNPCASAKTSGYDQQAIGSAPENALVDTVVAKSLGTTPEKVPSMAPLLVGPSLRGEQVTVK